MRSKARTRFTRPVDWRDCSVRQSASLPRCAAKESRRRTARRDIEIVAAAATKPTADQRRGRRNVLNRVGNVYNRRRIVNNPARRRNGIRRRRRRRRLPCASLPCDITRFPSGVMSHNGIFIRPARFPYPLAIAGFSRSPKRPIVPIGDR